MKQRGFTLIEVMVVLVIIAIGGMLGLGAINGSNSNITYGAMGMTESRCIEGYKFIMDQRGNSR